MAAPHLNPHPRIAVSSWSLHNKLGYSHTNGPAGSSTAPALPTWGPGEIKLFDLPAALRAHGYARVELCHFHIASLDPSYLEDLRAAFADQGVTIQTLLIDDGDITNPATRARDMAWINTWMGAAARLGAVHARVIAGKQKPTAEALAVSMSGLTHLANSAATQGVKLVTENWFDLTATPYEVHQILDGVPGLGFLADMGNWSGLSKYNDLAAIFARAQLCHAKATFKGDAMDEIDYAACIKAAETAGYQGPYTLIFADEGDEWEGLAKERAFIHGKITRPS
jgi:sugar phosphate isomerase/epimerase